MFRNLNYVEKFDVLLVCFHFSPRHARALCEFVAQVKESYPEKLLLTTYGAFSLGRLRQCWQNSEWYELFVRFVNGGDVLVIVNRAAHDYLRQITDKPVVYLPQLYPVEYAQQWYRRWEDKEKIILVVGHTEYSDLVWSCHIARGIQRRFQDHHIWVLVWPASDNLPSLAGARFQTLPALSWTEFLDTVGRSKLVINMDQGWTNGRVPADCAAVGTPCVGVNADRQMDLFPELVCEDIVGTESALKLAEKLILDRESYEVTQQKALQRLMTHSYEKGAARMRNLCDAWKHGNLSAALGSDSVVC